VRTVTLHRRALSRDRRIRPLRTGAVKTARLRQRRPLGLADARNNLFLSVGVAIGVGRSDLESHLNGSFHCRRMAMHVLGENVGLNELYGIYGSSPQARFST
jgi:hypothetical protein